MTKDSGNRSVPPLKMLRDIIGLSQSRFAEVTGLNINTVRALEIGRRAKGQPSNEQVTQIFMSIGAWWEPATERWLFTLADFGQPVVYTKEHFQDFRRELTEEARERAGLSFYLAFKLISFLESLKPLEVNGQFWHLNRLLDDRGAKSKAFTLAPQWDQAEKRTRGYRKIFPLISAEDEKLYVGLLERAKAERKKQLEEGIFTEPGAPKVVSGHKLTLTPQQHEAANLIARQSRKKPTERSPRKPAAG
jgi:transcriptional regulator with XRE-family HTH domain